MILFLNSGDWFSKELKTYCDNYKIDNLCVESSELLQSLAVGVNESGDFWFYKDRSFLVTDILAVYCGFGDKAMLLNEKNLNNYDRHYLYSSWHAYLQYFLLKVPRKIGVLDYNLWTGTILQLPSLYCYAAKFGLLCPAYFYSLDVQQLVNFTQGGNYYFCNSLSGSYFDFFGDLESDSILAVEKTMGYYGIVLFISGAFFAVKYDSSGWRPTVIAVSFCNALLLMLQSLGLVMAQVSFYYDESRESYLLYNLNLNFTLFSQFKYYYRVDIIATVMAILRGEKNVAIN